MSAFDVLIVGGGPCGLATAARLRERTPSALFSEGEHQRFHWLRNKEINLLKNKPAAVNDISGKVSIKVIDAVSSNWLGQWDNQFETCQIPYLRSPMFFHPDPFDLDGMIAYAYSNGRQKELKEITNVVGKELSKHQQKRKRRQKPIEVDARDEKDYYRPSTKLFHDYCNDIVDRYGLREVVSQEVCKNIEYDEIEDIFTVTTDLGVYTSKVTVIACGPIGEINYDYSQYPMGSCHTSHLFSGQVQFPPAEKKKAVMVVGGGLTSAQLCHRLVESKKADKVYFVTRGDIKVKHFDFDLEWVTKYKNYLKSVFWQLESDEERWNMIKEARNGGSVNPEYQNLLYEHEKSGKLTILKHSTATPSDWDGTHWNNVKINNEYNIPEPIDYIYYATGSTPDVERIDFMQDIIKNYPVETIDGIPCLTDDLEWCDDVPLYFVGRLACLRTGPASANLEGARSGAERVASSIQKRIRRIRSSNAAAVSQPKNILEILESGGNWYQVLAA